ncbi:MAG: RluA family pseudouridine synthase [Hylemonella sp.]
MTDGIEWVYVDDALLALNKSSGLLSVPGRGTDKQDCASARAQQLYADARVVHRLDMATSGLMLMARGPEMQRLLNRAFIERRICKRYIALVAGHLESTPSVWNDIDLPLMADWPRRPLQKVDRAGRPSQTRWRIVAWEEDARGYPCTRLELEPITGRSHQLRVHLQAIGHAILGDALYGPPDQDGATSRLMLHASSLSLIHPITGISMVLSSSPPF